MAYIDGLLANVGIKPEGGAEICIPYTSYEVAPASEVRRVQAAGKMTPYDSFPAEVEFTGSIDFIVNAAMVPILQLCYPDNNILTNFEVNGGTGMYKYTGCLVSDMSFECNLNEELTCSMSFTAKAREAGAAVSSPDSFSAFMGQNITLTGFASGDVESLSASVSNDISSYYSMIGESRTPSHLGQGWQEVSCEIRYNEDHGIDVAGSIVKLAAAVMKFKDTTAEPGELEITLKNLLPSEGGEERDPGDIIRFGLSYEAEEIEIDMAV